MQNLRSRNLIMDDFHSNNIFLTPSGAVRPIDAGIIPRRPGDVVNDAVARISFTNMVDALQAMRRQAGLPPGDYSAFIP